MSGIDLHVHSDKSDGTCTPSELVALAKKAGLSAFALTDHDTVAGVSEAVAAGQKAAVRVIPGVELSALYEGKDIHIVGLNIDPNCGELLSTMAHYRAARDTRNEKMMLLLQRQGFDITTQKLRERFPDAVLTRAHTARYLMEHGYTGSIAEGFERYISEGCPCYVAKEYIPLQQAIRLILQAGGSPVLAHPFQYHFTDPELETLVRQAAAYGLKGIEVFYTTHSKEQTQHSRRLADRYGLFESGGSDFHGSNKPDISIGTGFGNLHISETLLSFLTDNR